MTEREIWELLVNYNSHITANMIAIKSGWEYEAVRPVCNRFNWFMSQPEVINELAELKLPR